MPKRQIHYAKPSITELEIEYVNDAIRHGWGPRCYDYLIRFGDLVRSHLHVQHAFPTSSCTGALHLALAALEVGPGDQVIVPDATWIASVAPVQYLGAEPLFVDVLQDTWCIDPEAIERAINPRVKAILVVHLYGGAADMERIMAIARKHNLPVIEDAAEAIGTEIQGAKAGSIGDFGAFSFHGTKTITTGEGGVLVCNRDDLAERIGVLENHGRDPRVPRMFWCESVGYKYRMSNLQAALGCAQLERIDELVASKVANFRLYQKYTQQLEDLSWNAEPPGTRNGYWMPTFVLGESHAIERDELMGQLNARGIAARPFFYPVSSFPPFETVHENLVSQALGARGINLPNYFEMDEADVVYIAQQLEECLATKGAEQR